MSATPESRGRDARRLAPLLWGLLFLFVLRVAGQLIVGAGWGGPLPPFERWDSGLIYYPLLVAAQVAIIVLYAKACLDFTRGDGYFARPRRGLGRGLLIFGTLYSAAMITRYVVRMARMPDERWLGGTIPIFFHFVLATFILLAGRFHFTRGKPDAGRAG